MRRSYLSVLFLIFVIITSVYYSLQISASSKPVPDPTGKIVFYGDCGNATEVLHKAGIQVEPNASGTVVPPFDAWYKELTANLSVNNTNITEGEYLSLVKNNSKEYTQIGMKMESYVETLRSLEFRVSDPKSYALLAWLEFLVGDGELDLPTGNENASPDNYIWAEVAPRYYEDYVFPYLDSKISELEKSSGHGGLGMRVRLFLNQSVPELASNLSRLKKRTWWADKGLTPLHFSRIEYRRGYYALALLDYSYALSYYKVSRAIVGKEQVVNASAVDETVLKTFSKLHSAGIFWLDPLFVARLLPEFNQFHSLCSVINADSQQYKKYMLYLMGLELETETLGFLIWYELVNEMNEGT